MSLSRLTQMARDREEDRKAGRPERGLFTGRGQARDPRSSTPIGNRRRARGVARDVPCSRLSRKSLRICGCSIGLIGDSRVSKIDRFLVVVTIGYILSPLDFIPDVVPFFGQIDDIFLLILSLQRLVSNAGLRVLRDHWHGDPREISDINLAGMLSAAGFFLPVQLRRRLRRMANRGRR